MLLISCVAITIYDSTMQAFDGLLTVYTDLCMHFRSLTLSKMNNLPDDMVLYLWQDCAETA